MHIPMAMMIAPAAINATSIVSQLTICFRHIFGPRHSPPSDVWYCFVLLSWVAKAVAIGGGAIMGERGDWNRALLAPCRMALRQLSASGKSIRRYGAQDGKP